MKKFKIFFIPLIIFIFFFINNFKEKVKISIGYKNDIIFNLKKYQNFENIWNDRDYMNSVQNSAINDFYILKQDRHNKTKIAIIVKEKIKIIRVLCEKNDNSHYDDWEKLDLNFYIKGDSCFHKKSVSKKFDVGSYLLKAGGPLSSDPIFIKDLRDIKNFQIKN